MESFPDCDLYSSLLLSLPISVSAKENRHNDGGKGNEDEQSFVSRVYDSIDAPRGSHSTSGMVRTFSDASKDKKVAVEENEQGILNGEEGEPPVVMHEAAVDTPNTISSESGGIPEEAAGQGDQRAGTPDATLAVVERATPSGVIVDPTVSRLVWRIVSTCISFHHYKSLMYTLFNIAYCSWRRRRSCP